jgi:hypothetical protein
MSRFSGKMSDQKKVPGQKNKGIIREHKMSLVKEAYDRACSVWNDGTGRISMNNRYHSYMKPAEHPYMYLPKSIRPKERAVMDKDFPVFSSLVAW